MTKTQFTYVTYIATTAETLWKALLDGEFTRQYWGHENVSDWQPGIRMGASTSRCNTRRGHLGRGRGRFCP